MRTLLLLSALCLALLGCSSGDAPPPPPAAQTDPVTELRVAIVGAADVDSVLAVWGEQHEVRVLRAPDRVGASLVEFDAWEWASVDPADFQAIEGRERALAWRRDTWWIFTRPGVAAPDAAELARMGESFGRVRDREGERGPFLAMALVDGAWPAADEAAVAPRLDSESLVELAAYFGRLGRRARSFDASDPAANFEGVVALLAPRSFAHRAGLIADGWSATPVLGLRDASGSRPARERLLAVPVGAAQSDLARELARDLAEIFGQRRTLDGWEGPGSARSREVLPMVPQDAAAFAEHLEEALDAILDRRRSAEDAMRQAQSRWQAGP